MCPLHSRYNVPSPRSPTKGTDEKRFLTPFPPPARFRGGRTGGIGSTIRKAKRNWRHCGSASNVARPTDTNRGNMRRQSVWDWRRAFTPAAVPERKSRMSPFAPSEVCRCHHGSSGVPEFRSSGVPEFRSSGVPEFRSSGVPEFRSSGVPEFRSSGVPEFRSSGVPEFRSSGVPEFRSSGDSIHNS